MDTIRGKLHCHKVVEVFLITEFIFQVSLFYTNYLQCLFSTLRNEGKKSFKICILFLSLP